MKVIIIILGILSNAAASATLKYAVNHSQPSLKDPLGLFMNLPLIGGLGLYGISFCLYVAALKMMPLNLAYPL